VSANGKPVPGKMVGLFAIIPASVDRPQFHLLAQWYTPAGILVPRRQVAVQMMDPEALCRMFVELANAGIVQHEVEEDGVKVNRPIPPMDLTIPGPPQPEVPSSRIIEVPP